MFIQTEETPNPQALKFIVGRPVSPQGACEFNHTQKAPHPSPLAQQLLEIENVVNVLLGSDFIAVTKTPEIDWYIIKPLVLGVLLEFFLSNKPIFLSGSKSVLEDTSKDTPLIQEIKELLDQRIRPAVAMDG